MSKTIFSVDLEVDGLYGNSFAAAAVVIKNGQEIARFEGRVSGFIDPWSPIIPHGIMKMFNYNIKNYSSSEELEEALWGFYAQHCLEEGQWGLSPKKDVQVIAHCGSPVESGFFRRCIERDESRTFQGPLPLHEVGTALELVGENPTSVDSYVQKHGLEVDFDGSSHHPTYDCLVAAVVWQHITSS